ncbi:MAG: hypothetical protein CM1200mP9_09670 [Gammaproteobacteria bacterium]|nr:MAG: hypothetical protein CM1200mP9_09670 [Gammaproteobacteria bacterium]
MVRDPDQRKTLADLNRSAVEAYIGPTSGRPTALAHQEADKRLRMLNAVLWQAEHMHEIPLLIVACYQFDGPVGDGVPTVAVDHLARSPKPAASSSCIGSRGSANYPRIIQSRRRTKNTESSGRHGRLLSYPRGVPAWEFRPRDAITGCRDGSMGPVDIA